MARPKINDRRIGKCKHTGETIEQVWDGREWMCLHNDEDEEQP